jgi:hypothetical protein
MSKQSLKKEIREEVKDVLKEREEFRIKKLEDESPWNKAYEEAWHREYEAENAKYFSEGKKY